MKGPQKNINKVSEEVAKQIERSQTEKDDAMLRNFTFEQGKKQPKDYIGLSDPVMEGIYAQAYRLYNTGKYKDALQLFRLLGSLAPTEARYILGMAACFHLLKEFNDALETYAVVAILDPNNPIPFYHASDCLIQQNDPYSAIIMLELALKTAKDKPEYKTLRDRVVMTIESLKAKTKEMTPIEE